MSTKAGQLLWNRQRISILEEQLVLDVDTGLTQINRSFDSSSVNEPFLGVISLVSPVDGQLPASRVHVIPEAPLSEWIGITHGEPYLNPDTQTVHVRFTNSGPARTINVLFWDPHTAIGPGQADTYHAILIPPAPPGPIPPGPPPPDQFLGVAAKYAKLAHTTLTNTGSTVDTGDIGVSPGTSITGFPPGIVIGTIHINDADAAAAKVAATAAYNTLAAQASSADLTGQDLGGMTLTPGVYFFATSAPLTGILTLDALGDPNAIFVFKIGSTLITAGASSVVLVNGAQARNVYWQVGSSATLGTTSKLKGTIIAQASVTLTTGAILDGRAFALTGAVTQDSNTVSVPT